MTESGSGNETSQISLTDVDIFERVRDGDEVAFEELYRRTAPFLYDRLLTMLGQAASAEDCLQATFLSAWQRRDQLRDATKIRAWLAKIARNEGLKMIANNRRVTSDSDLDTVHDDDAGPEEVVLRGEAQRLVWDAARSLDERQLTAVDLNMRHGMSMDDVAEVLGLEPAHAAVIMQRAREALGHAVTRLLVVRQRSRCARLDELVPKDLTVVSQEQKATVDNHIRRCYTCKSLAQSVVQPAALFGAIGIVALPQALRELHPQPTSPLSSAQLAASRTSQLRNFVTKNAIAAGALALILAIAGGIALHPHFNQDTSAATAKSQVSSLPVSTATPTVSPPAITTPQSPSDVWSNALTKLQSANSYSVLDDNSAFSPHYLVSDLHVVQGVGWYGTVKNINAGPEPIELVYVGGNLYVHGGTAFVDAHFEFGLTDQQAQALGQDWLNLTTDDPGSAQTIELSTSQLIDTTQLVNALKPVGDVTEAATSSVNGITVLTLTDGSLQVVVPQDGSGDPIHATKGQETFDITALNAAFTLPSPAPTKSLSQLKAAAPGF